MAEPECWEEPGLQGSEQDLRREVELPRAAVVDLREQLEVVEGQTSRVRASGDINVDVDDVDGNDEGKRQRSVATPCRVFPELITEEEEAVEEQVYAASEELVAERREAWAERKAARHTLAWLWVQRRRPDLELRLNGVFGLTPPPADAPWRERRRDQELARR